MQTKFKDGSVLVWGGCARDAELSFVGDDQKRLCKVGLAVGKRPDPEGGEKPVTVWCNVVAWHELASVLSIARKGDPVLVGGRLKTHEYEGKPYTDLVAEWLWVCSIPSAADTVAPPPPAAGAPQFDQFSNVADDDGELPF